MKKSAVKEISSLRPPKPPQSSPPRFFAATPALHAWPARPAASLAPARPLLVGSKGNDASCCSKAPLLCVPQEKFPRRRRAAGEGLDCRPTGTPPSGDPRPVHSPGPCPLPACARQTLACLQRPVQAVAVLEGAGVPRLFPEYFTLRTHLHLHPSSRPPPEPSGHTGVGQAPSAERAWSWPPDIPWCAPGGWGGGAGDPSPAGPRACAVVQVTPPGQQRASSPGPARAAPSLCGPRHQQNLASGSA